MSSLDQFSAALLRRTGSLIPLRDEQIRMLWAHYELVVRWNRRMSLTTVTELEIAVERHYCESLFLAGRLPEGDSRVWDFGSGAGFPGFPVAVVRPRLQVWLVESNRRKCAFLREACAGLGNVHVVADRAEGIADNTEWVISRAVRPLDVVQVAAKKAKSVALLVGAEDAQSLARLPGLISPRCDLLPWGSKRFLFTADVPRETRVSQEACST